MASAAVATRDATATSPAHAQLLKPVARVPGFTPRRLLHVPTAAAAAAAAAPGSSNSMNSKQAGGVGKLSEMRSGRRTDHVRRIDLSLKPEEEEKEEVVEAAHLQRGEDEEGVKLEKWQCQEMEEEDDRHRKGEPATDHERRRLALAVAEHMRTAEERRRTGSGTASTAAAGDGDGEDDAAEMSSSPRTSEGGTTTALASRSEPRVRLRARRSKPGSSNSKHVSVAAPGLEGKEDEDCSGQQLAAMALEDPGPQAQPGGGKLRGFKVLDDSMGYDGEQVVEMQLRVSKH